jgi:hypothetical protein
MREPRAARSGEFVDGSIRKSFADPAIVHGVCCLALTAGFLGPRIALAIWWIFGDKVDLAFDSWVWPLLGLIFLPWTTLAYVLVWSPVVGVDGAEWIIVALGLVADVATYSSRAAASRYQTSSGY